MAFARDVSTDSDAHYKMPVNCKIRNRGKDNGVR